ncbi:tetratricopeptide repeat protein [Geothrix sp. SG200]|uniref:tetratricopeptide repeat protein n=1 Tax=Geothrix sp. SG200 TaxID=2922865 RepID=UPI001FACE163|nr:tetratricopeptide repeat protein [Geothrix sp. SG200]
MARPTKNREIQVQKPAQSLAHFQTKLGKNEDEDGGLLKPILIGIGVLVLAGLTYGGWSAYQTQAVEKHEAALSALEMEVEGDGVTPVPPAEVEKRMRERLGRLEALVNQAPSSRKAATAGLLSSWRLALDGKEQAPSKAVDPWGKIRLAQRALALGQADAARAQLDGLRAKATPGEPWAEAFWASQMDVDRLAGDRAQAMKDLAEYKARFKGRGDAGTFESLIQSI